MWHRIVIMGEHSEIVYNIDEYEPIKDILCMYDESWYHAHRGKEWDKMELFRWIIDGISPKVFHYAKTIAVKVSEDELVVLKDIYMDTNKESNNLYRFDTLKQNISLNSWGWIMESIEQIKLVIPIHSFQNFNGDIFPIDYMIHYTKDVLPRVSSSSRSFVVSDGKNTKTLFSNKDFPPSLRDSCKNNDIEVFQNLCKIQNIDNINIFNKDYIEDTNAERRNHLHIKTRP